MNTFRCKYCSYIGQISDFEIDHSTPISRNPLLANLLSNLEYICSGCNRQKSDKTVSEYTFWRLLNPLAANYGPISNNK